MTWKSDAKNRSRFSGRVAGVSRDHEVACGLKYIATKGFQLCETPPDVSLVGLEHLNGPVGRHSHRAFRDLVPARSGRHGPGVQGARHTAEPHRRGEGPASGTCRGS